MRNSLSARSACFSGEGAWLKAQFAIHRNMVKPSCLAVSAAGGKTPFTARALIGSDRRFPNRLAKKTGRLR
ncbi:MAG: hypothetical protein AB1670_18375, partial [Pseudomonadota bacterium]